MKKNILKRLLALLLATVSLLCFTACTNDDLPENTETPSESVSDGSNETEEENKPVVSGDRLIYYEDFEDMEVSDDSNKVIEALGWTIDTAENRAYTDNTTSYGIVKENNGNKALKLENNKENAKDSYVIVLDEDAVYQYVLGNYTYQYDVTYQTGGNSDRYISLVSSYDGNYYRGFFFRNKGIASHQIHSDGLYYNCDSENDPVYSGATDNNAIVKKLLGKTYISQKQAFRNISFSIRYAINWERGIQVSMRINTPGYPGTGKWIVVSKVLTPPNSNPFFSAVAGGSAFALKTGGSQNGYVDNIIIWEGTGEEPADKSNPLVKTR